MPDTETLAFYDTQAAHYHKRLGQSEPDQDLRDFMDHLPKGARILDLGCGPATASAHMRAAGFHPDPVDAAQGMVTLANETYDINARVMEFDDLTARDTYDAVWANFSLLHAPRDALPRHLGAIHTALRSGGLLHTGMKTGTGVHRDTLGRQYTFVTTSEWDGLLTAAGFSIIRTRTGAAVGCAGTNDPFLITLARKDG